jgi:hypothetical protein
VAPQRGRGFWSRHTKQGKPSRSVSPDRSIAALIEAGTIPGLSALGLLLLTGP